MVLSKDDPHYQQCSVTVMDNIADNHISFDKDGVCNYFHEYKLVETQLKSDGAHEERLHRIVEKIRKAGKNKSYDCLIGLSGGVDSSYVAWLIRQYGLRPLAVHLDNGWNSELAVKNIESIVNTLNIDLYTLVINWEEFKDIQLAYLRASVVDIEVVSDHAIFSTMYKLAKEKNINYIVSGTNVATEFIMPPDWLYKKMDFANLSNIHKKYGSLKLKTYPIFDFKKYLYYSAVLRLNPISILDYVDYNKNNVKKLIGDKLGWRDYGGKHYESTFTKFYQAYILPTKFKIDKRKPHLSNLICSGQLTKEEALKELQFPLYEESELRFDKAYVLKKLGLTDKEFDSLMALPPRKHEEFGTDTPLKERYMNFLRRTEKIRRLVKFGNSE